MFGVIGVFDLASIVLISRKNGVSRSANLGLSFRYWFRKPI